MGVVNEMGADYTTSDLERKWNEEAGERIMSRYGDKYLTNSETSLWIAGYLDAKRSSQEEIDRLNYELGVIIKDRDNLLSSNERDILKKIAELVAEF